MANRQKHSVKPLGSMLEELIGALGIKDKLRQYEAVSNWNAIVGEHIAGAAEPVKIVQGVLIVRVRSAAWRNELTMRKHEIIGKLNATIGLEAVRDIRFQ